MSKSRKKAIKTLKPNKVWIPAAISIGFVVYLLFTDDKFRPERLKLILMASAGPLAIAAIFLVIREVAYMFRIKFLSENKLSFKSCFQIILLWEFASAVTPFVVGGTPVAIFLFMKEKINLGKSMAFAMVTAIMDNLYLVLMVPVIYFVLRGNLFDYSSSDIFSNNLPTLLLMSYIMIIFYTSVMIFALFMQPRLFKWILLKITSIGILRRWRYGAYQHGNEIMMASKELKGKSFRFWWRIFYTTFISWTARFIMINFLILAFVDIGFFEELIVFAKHLLLWVITLISPTPGGAGAAEGGFIVFFQDLMGEYTGAITIVWRAYNYYIFLLLGILVLPRWIRRVYSSSDAKQVPEE